ncbi:hypothetical protein [Pseudofulvimonas gallinarii]|uniref:Uncharacterized protein n=1 Tax=Pseudofulvimonas gallinarii TaxID=634155 RepID=A0A4V3UTT8_9GAMM|nr:hypothetical protein [Pseudofulvimonas gallinarii]TCS93342.1 hypothetical protein EDC25_12823 [Pseudofulvimonas gallinarii]THD11921.1 hypothetical protein B1808_14035 [Pseudofulvimonas gallinarii]
MKCLIIRAELLGAFPFGQVAFAQVPDLYDPETLRTFSPQFHDANWLQLLRDNYASETLILADLTVDGVTYPDVGVRIRPDRNRPRDGWAVSVAVRPADASAAPAPRARTGASK